MCVPLLARERVLGALNVYRNGEDAAFTDEEVELVERFATMAALAYDSARQRETLREQVKRDGLTGLLNHRACHERLREELARGGPVAGVVLLDLDHFKVINDAHGHAEGDRVLAAAAERLRSVVRAADVVGRLGGEEFVLILPGVDAEAAEDCAERARAALAELTVRGPPLAARRASPRPRRRRRGRGAARERRRRAVLGQALRPRPDRAATCAARCGPRGEQRNEIAALLERGTARSAPSSSRSSSSPRAAPAGYEALARFEAEPPRGPDEWFAQAHRVGLGAELEALALRAALAVPGRPEGTFLALNVSPRALLTAPVRAALPEDLTGIVIELTEHELFGAEGELEAELAALRARGARVALDDAGAGYAGLQQIIRDRARHPQARPRAGPRRARRRSRQALLEALIGFASTTGAAICAEGVEDLDDLRALVALDVTYAQGYGLARPGAAVAALAAGRRRQRGRRPRRPARRRPRRGVAGACRSGLAELADDLGAATTIADLGAAGRCAADLLGADDVALMRVDGERPTISSCSPRTTTTCRAALAARRLPGHPLRARPPRPGPGRRGRRGRRPGRARRARALGIGAVLIVPVDLRPRPPRAARGLPRPPAGLPAREVDRARVLAQQFGAAIYRLTA